MASLFNRPVVWRMAARTSRIHGIHRNPAIQLAGFSNKPRIYGAPTNAQKHVRSLHTLVDTIKDKEHTLPTTEGQEGPQPPTTNQAYLQVDPFDHLQHIKKCVAEYPHFFNEEERNAILQLLTTWSSVWPILYVAPNNAETVFTLLKNVVTCFNTSLPDSMRYRQCNILLGMKNSGKSRLVETLRQAVQLQYPESITLFLEPETVRNTTIAALVKKECDKRDIAVNGTTLPEVLESLASDNRSLLVVVDEAQDLYPNINTPKKDAAFEQTVALVGELHLLAQQPGCVCWLTGSSQTLYHLALAGEHPKFYGVYRHLNEKKYTPLHHLALRDSQSIREFLHLAKNLILSEDEVAEYYELYGGAMGDLLQRKRLPRTYIDAWDKTAQSVLLALVLAQPTSNAAKPWDLVPIPAHIAREVIAHAKPGCAPDIELQRLCDFYLLERDNQEQYHVAYPSALSHCSPFEGGAPTQRIQRATDTLAIDDILGFLEVVLGGMHNIPLQVTAKIRRFESHPHSIVHVLLWLCCPPGVDFDSSSRSQTGEGDVVILSKYRHYLEFKAEKGDSISEAVDQISDKRYNVTFPRSESFQQKPAFHYGIKWSEKSTHITVEVYAEDNAKDTDLWKNTLSKGPFTIYAPKSVYLYMFLYCYIFFDFKSVV